MDLPILPSNNLYSFSTFLGIFFILFFLVYPINRINIIEIEQIELSGDCEKLKQEMNNSQKAVQRLETRVDDLKNNIDKKYGKPDSIEKLNIENIYGKLKNKEYREYLKFCFDYEDKIIPESEDINKIEIVQSQIEKKLFHIEIITTDIGTKTLLIKQKIKQESKWKFVNAIGVGLGVFLLLFGINNWYNKIQKPLDEKQKMENQKNKSNIEIKE